MEHSSYHTKLRSKTESHIDVSDLCYGRKRNHSTHVMLLDGTEGAEQHPQYTQYKEYIGNLTVPEHVGSDDTVHNLN